MTGPGLEPAPQPDPRLGRAVGFTVLETLIAVTLVGVLAAIVVPYVLGELKKSRELRVLGDLRAIEAAIETYQADLADLPDDLDQVGMDVPLDPWGHEYRYFPFKGNNWRGSARKDRFLVPINSTYDLYSVGPDGESRPPLTAPQSWDDLIRANNGEYMGPASEY